MEDLAAACEKDVLAVFPDMCPEYLGRLLREDGSDLHDSGRLIIDILDKAESGQPYPKRQNPHLKRKRVDGASGDRTHSQQRDETGQAEEGENDASEQRKEYGRDGLGSEHDHPTYLKTSRELLMQEFPRIFAKDVVSILQENGNRLYSAFSALHGLVSEENHDHLYLRRPRPRKNLGWQGGLIEETIQGMESGPEKRALQDFHLARTRFHEQLSQAETERRKEQENLDRSMAEGSIDDCQCCYDQYPLNRMVHCDGDVLHWFCISCAKKMAETQIGLSKHELLCMSTDSCGAGFSRDQRGMFLDAKLSIALERIEQEAVLRMAGIENLETCPFCPFAAECEPVKVNKEFACKNPECEVVSCRMCRQETHIPKTCEEAANDAGISVQHAVEEAMSAALIRKCNKCDTSFIKVDGCNKMTCSRRGCGNTQCYVCHRSCDYSHFNDISRGGAKGRCPLYDPSVEQRHQDEVLAAEALARKQAIERNPGMAVDITKLSVSDKLRQDDEQRKQADMRVFAPARFENATQARLQVLTRQLHATTLKNHGHMAGMNQQQPGTQPHLQAMLERANRQLEALLSASTDPGQVKFGAGAAVTDQEHGPNEETLPEATNDHLAPLQARIPGVYAPSQPWGPRQVVPPPFRPPTYPGLQIPAQPPQNRPSDGMDAMANTQGYPQYAAAWMGDRMKRT